MIVYKVRHHLIWVLFQAYDRLGISRVEVCGRVGHLINYYFERTHLLDVLFLGLNPEVIS